MMVAEKLVDVRSEQWVPVRLGMVAVNIDDEFAFMFKESSVVTLSSM